MTFRHRYRILIATSAALALSACVGSGSGGGGGGGGGGAGGGGAGAPVTSSSYDTNYNRVTSVAPTSDMPTSLNAAFNGAVKTEIIEGTTAVGELLADLSLELNWTDSPDPNETNVWSGSVTNLRGTLNGNPFTASGQLDVVTDQNAVQRTETTVNVPGVGPVTTAVGGTQIAMAGSVTLDNEPLNAGMLLGGNCFGPQCAAIAGPASGTLTDSIVFPDYVLGGTFYAER